MRRGYTRKRRRDQVACLVAVFGGTHSGARCSCGPSGVDCRCRLGAIGWVWALESDPARRGRYIASHDVTGARHRTRGSPPGVHRPRVAQTPNGVGRGDRVSPHFRPNGENVLGTYDNTCVGRSPGRILCWHVPPRTWRLALFVVGTPGSARAMRRGSRGVPWFNTASVLLARLGNLRGNLRSRLRLPSVPLGAMPALARTAQPGSILAGLSAIGDDVHAEGAPTPCNRVAGHGGTRVRRRRTMVTHPTLTPETIACLGTLLRAPATGPADGTHTGELPSPRTPGSEDPARWSSPRSDDHSRIPAN